LKVQTSFKDKGGFVSAHWDGTAATEEKIKD
jgi:prolyl-tRNA synthetase